MLFKIVMFLLFGLIIWNLAQGMRYLVTDQGRTKRTVRSLTWRVALSGLLVIFLVVGALRGWIKPHTLQGHASQQNSPRI